MWFLCGFRDYTLKISNERADLIIHKTLFESGWVTDENNEWMIRLPWHLSPLLYVGSTIRKFAFALGLFPCYLMNGYRNNIYMNRASTIWKTTHLACVRCRSLCRGQLCTWRPVCFVITERWSSLPLLILFYLAHLMVFRYWWFECTRNCWYDMGD